MHRQELFQKCNYYLGRFVHEVKVSNASGNFDINTIAENFMIPILSIVYKCDDLINLNLVQNNFPGVDLGSANSRISFQITSDPSSAKIAKTLEKFRLHNLHQRFDTVYVYVITEKQSSNDADVLKKEISILPINFDIKNNIIDYSDLASQLPNLTNEQLEMIFNILRTEFDKRDTHLKFSQELERFVEFSQIKIDVEKRTRKYIPAIFVETSDIKDQMRFFSHPIFFTRKIDDLVDRIHLSYLNESLEKVGENKIEFDLNTISKLPIAGNIIDLEVRLLKQKSALTQLSEIVRPYSGSGPKEKQYDPTDARRSPWQIYRLRIQGVAYGILRTINEMKSAIELVGMKIFLITGMAGQGKTNFVCDVVENQYKKFAIPSIFIPARELNVYAGPDRIFKFITNNRYAPSVNNLHGLLEIFDAIAKENQKPFIIAIDGINEITSLTEFNAELKIFLSAVCQYDLVKVIITCRNEFFDQRFSDLFHENFANRIHHVKDLRAEMSGGNKKLLLKNYLKHFEIKITLSRKAAQFLEDDLLLLRIFSEIHAGTEPGHIASIYKGDLFEEYLKLKIKNFPKELQGSVMATLYKIVSRMLHDDQYSAQMIHDFSKSESDIIEILISEDIVLRRELPATGLTLIDQENISFTYDELRDFIIAHFIVAVVSIKDMAFLQQIFDKIPTLPIYEGVFRYCYILSRKFARNSVVELCQNSPDFVAHYAKNLSLITPKVQSSDDVVRVKEILETSDSVLDVQYVSHFLFHARENTDILNIKILLDYINSLDDQKCERFLKIFFSSYYGQAGSSWQDNIDNYIKGVPISQCGSLDVSDDQLIFLIQVSSFASWRFSESFQNQVQRTLKNGRGQSALDFLQVARASIIIININDIVHSIG